jgi:Fe-S cluster assembly protein SufD
VTVIETYAGLHDGRYFTNAVTELVAQENAVVDHYRAVREGVEGFHISTQQFHLHRSSNVTSNNICLGATLVRNNIDAVLDGEGSECTLNGIYLAVGQEHVDNHLRVDHAKAHCDSREYYKGVLSDASSGVFSGRILVREGAQKTDAKQTNMSLLLSDSARVQSKPQLEIFADDVKCTHGATIGQIDEDAIFYLRSRGLSATDARNMMVYAFAKENLDRIRIEPLRIQLEDLLLARLPHGEALGRQR